MAIIRVFAFAFILSIGFAVNAASYVSHKLVGNELTIQSDEYQLQLKALAQGAIEVNYLAAGKRPFPSFAKDEDINFDKIKSVFVESDYSLTFSVNQLKAVINKQSLQIRFYRDNELLIAEESGFFETNTLHGFRFSLDKSEQLMGTGERVLGMDRRGHRLPLYNRAHYGYTTNSKQMNFSIPAIMSDKKYIVLFDNSAKGWIDLGSSEADVLQFEAVAGRSSYIVFSDKTYPKLIEQYVSVTGKQPLPPRWAFGNHASRFGYKSQQEVLDTIALYRELNIPVDSIILDLYWFGKDIKGHMGNLDWDRAAFPSPDSMIKQLKGQGVKTVLISEPFVLSTSKRWEEANRANALAKNIAGNKTKTFDFYFGNTGLIDVFSEDGQDWFSNIYQGLAKQGVAGVWGDLGEPEVHPSDMLHTLSQHTNINNTNERKPLTATADEIHNAYGHQWAKMVEQSLLTYQPNNRPFIIMRAGFAGSQRYGMIPWTGDVSRSWGGLKPQVELSLQMSLLGLSYTHSDLGGFAGDNYDKSLYIRWLQYGVFQPIYRPHAQDAVPPEPVFHDQETQDIIREYIDLRYRLLPYNYTLAYQNSISGMPLMRPMFFEDETNKDLIHDKEQYLWGDSFLVKPVTSADVSEVKINLPAGNWFNFWTGQLYQGEQTIVYPVDLSTLPVLVRAGSIIPSVDTIQSMDNYSSKHLKLDYYFDPNTPSSNAQMYEDDGISKDSLTANKYQLLAFSAKVLKADKNQQLKVTLENTTPSQSYQGMPESRQITLTIHNWQKPSSDILLNDKPMLRVSTKSGLENGHNVAWFDATNNKLTLKFPWHKNKTNELFIDLD